MCFVRLLLFSFIFQMLLSFSGCFLAEFFNLFLFESFTFLRFHFFELCVDFSSLRYGLLIYNCGVSLVEFWILRESCSWTRFLNFMLRGFLSTNRCCKSWLCVGVDWKTSRCHTWILGLVIVKVKDSHIRIQLSCCGSFDSVVSNLLIYCGNLHLFLI